MPKEFWHPLITEKSFQVLQELKRNFDFILIGGWAVYFYTHNLKSKDIDIIVDLKTLSQLKQKYEVYKNERLKKYEIKIEGVDVDIYIPYWSDLGLKTEEIIKNTVWREGFNLPVKEILLVLKLFIYSQRKTSLKGKKDLIDVISLLILNDFDFKIYKEILKKNNLDYLRKELKEIFFSHNQIEEIGLNQKKFSDLKKKILSLL